MCKLISLFLLSLLSITSSIIGNEQDPSIIYRKRSYDNGKIYAHLVLNNGSKWLVPWISKDKCAKWHPEDTILGSYYCQYKNETYIRLTNVNKKEKIDVGFVSNFEITDETLCIQDINTDSCIITLTNGVKYKIQNKSLYGLWSVPANDLVACWQVGDFIMVLGGKKSRYSLLNTSLLDPSFTNKMLNELINQQHFNPEFVVDAEAS